MVKEQIHIIEKQYAYLLLPNKNNYENRNDPIGIFSDLTFVTGEWLCGR